MKAVNCDVCGKRFGPSLKAEPLADGGELWWFACEHCRYQYEAARISARGLEIRAEMEALKALERKPGRVLRKIARLEREMAAEVQKPG